MSAVEIVHPERPTAPVEATILDPNHMVAMTQVAAALAESDILPKSYRGNAANVLVAMIAGTKHGWDPVTACQQFIVIEGQISMRAEAMLASVRARGHAISGENDGRSATVTGRRADTGEEHTASFSFDDAERAGLCKLGEDGFPIATSKNGNVLPWQAYPDAMCWARAVSKLCRRLFPDVIAGVSYTPEELTDQERSRAIDRASMPAAGRRAAVTGGREIGEHAGSPVEIEPRPDWVATIEATIAALDPVRYAEVFHRFAAKGWTAGDAVHVELIPERVRPSVRDSIESIRLSDVPFAQPHLVEQLEAVDQVAELVEAFTGGRTSDPRELAQAEARALVETLAPGSDQA